MKMVRHETIMINLDSLAFLTVIKRTFETVKVFFDFKKHFPVISSVENMVDPISNKFSRLPRHKNTLLFDWRASLFSLYEMISTPFSFLHVDYTQTLYFWKGYFLIRRERKEKKKRNR